MTTPARHLATHESSLSQSTQLSEGLCIDAYRCAFNSLYVQGIRRWSLLQGQILQVQFVYVAACVKTWWLMLPVSEYLSIYCCILQDSYERGWPAIWSVCKHAWRWMYVYVHYVQQIYAFLGNQIQELIEVQDTIKGFNSLTYTHIAVLPWLLGTLHRFRILSSKLSLTITTTCLP